MAQHLVQGSEVVFEHNFAIWKLDTESGKAGEVAITRRGASAGPGVDRVRLSDQIAELQLSPDGKKIAFIVRGEIFAASAADGGDAARVSNSTPKSINSRGRPTAAGSSTFRSATLFRTCFFMTSPAPPRRN